MGCGGGEGREESSRGNSVGNLSRSKGSNQLKNIVINILEGQTTGSGGLQQQAQATPRKVAALSSRERSRGGSPKKVEHSRWGSKSRGPKISRFLFLSRPPFSLFFLSHCVVFSWFSGGVSVGTSNVLVFALKLSCPGGLRPWHFRRSTGSHQL